MASKKPTMILRSKTDLSSDAIASLSDDAAWKMIYSLKGEPKTKPITVCFTGFGDTEKKTLTTLAKNAGLEVRTGVSPVLDYLCAGPTAGPSKMSQAREYGVRVLTLSEFERIAELGELPDS